MVGKKVYQDRNWLYEHYIINEESTYDMSSMAQCSPSTVWLWLYKHDIPVRSLSESHFVARRNYLTVSSGLLELLEGELLGDGHLGMNGRYSANYAHGSKYRDYLIWLSKKLLGFGIGQTGKITYRISTYGTGVYRYCSKSYSELTPILRRFYPNGKKIAPKDLILTPTIVRHWFLGDGALEHHSAARRNIVFYTNGFDVESIEYLISEFSRNGFIATRQPSRNTIRISVYSTEDLLAWMGKCPDGIKHIYGYKWGL